MIDWEHIGSDERRRLWMATLAKLCAPGDAVKVVEGLVAMLPMLADLPDGAFTQDTLHHVALQAKRSPSYAELRKSLDEWWGANRPKLTALPAPDDSWQAKYDQHLEQCRQDWSNPEVVRAALAKLQGHPMKDQMGRLLGMAVARFGSANLKLVPPQWHPHG